MDLKGIAGALAAIIADKIILSWTWTTSWTGVKNPMPPKWNYFDEAKDPLIAGVSPDLMAKLDMARGKAGIPFIISSGLRTCATNTAALGAQHSTHIAGLAVDLGLGHLVLGYDRDHARYVMLNALLDSGFRRVGLYPNHIHADIGQDPDYTQDVSWMGQDGG